MKKQNFYSQKSLKEDRLISVTVMSFFTVLIVQYFILTFFDLFDTGVARQIQMASKVIVGIFFASTFLIVFRRSYMLFLSGYVGAIFIFLVNYLFFPQNSEFLFKLIIPFFLMCIPCFIYTFSIKNKRVFLRIMYKTSDLVLMLGTLIGIGAFINIVAVEGYSMALSYYMLLPGVLNVQKYLTKKQPRLLFKSGIAFLTIVLFGARGPIMCFAIYVVLAIMKNAKKPSYPSLLAYLSLVPLLSFGIIYFRSIIVKVNDILMNFGMEPRTLRLLLSGEILQGSGRDEIQAVIINLIADNPIFGIGIAGDRLAVGMHAHNFFIEILSGFGVIVGSFIILGFTWICYNALVRKNKFDSDMALLWFSLGFLPLLVSGSYLTALNFWIFLGVGMSKVKTQNIQLEVESVE